MNYCKTCRRHLNGALSCPGCGATGVELSSVQDVRSTVNMPRIEDGAQPPPGAVAERVPAAELDYEPSEPLADTSAASRPAAKRQPEARVVRRAGASASSRAKPGTGPVRHVEPNPPAEPETESADDAEAEDAIPAAAPTLALPAASHTKATALPSPAVSHARALDTPFDDADDAAQDALDAQDADEDYGADDHRGRRAPRRRGLGLMVTGGCAGIAVVGFLVFGNSGGPAPTTTTVVTTSAAVHHSAGGTVSIPAAPSTSAAPTTTSASPSPSPSKSKSPTHAPSTTKPAPTKSTAPPSSTASASPTATRTTKPAPSSTAPTCWLFC